MQSGSRLMIIGSVLLLCPMFAAAAPHAVQPASLPEIVAPKAEKQAASPVHAIIDTNGTFNRIVIPQSEQLPKWQPASRPGTSARDMPAQA